MERVQEICAADIYKKWSIDWVLAEMLAMHYLKVMMITSELMNFTDALNLKLKHLPTSGASMTHMSMI